MISDATGGRARRCCRRRESRRSCGGAWTFELALTLEELMEDLDAGWADQQPVATAPLRERIAVDASGGGS